MLSEHLSPKLMLQKELISFHIPVQDFKGLFIHAECSYLVGVKYNSGLILLRREGRKLYLHLSARGIWETECGYVAWTLPSLED